MPASGGEKAEQVTDKGGSHPFESWNGGTIYYQKTGGLFGRPLAGGPERRIVDSLDCCGMFWPVEDGIYHTGILPKGGPRARELRFLEFATGRIRSLQRIEAAGVQKLSVSPDRKTFLYSGGAPVESATTDLMLIENFR